MATSKKNAAAASPAAGKETPVPAPAAAPAKAPAAKPATKAKAAPAKVPAAKATTTKAPAAKAAPRRSVAAKPAGTKPAPPRAAAAKSAAKPANNLNTAAVQASKDVLARAIAAAQAVTIDKPLGKPKAEKSAKAEKEPKGAKAKKAKLVRDSFTMPEGEYAQIASLKKRLLDKGVVSKKSEILRAGIALLAALDDARLAAAMGQVEIIKTGRPAKAGK